MERSGGSSSSSSPQQRRELQGPRPAPLSVRKDSHKIKKPPAASAAEPAQVRQPVIIYTLSPKVIHAEPSEFMSVVQRLTGVRRPLPPPSMSYPLPQPPPPPVQPYEFPFPLPFPLPLPLYGQQALDDAPSPAARLAAMERAAAGGEEHGAPPLPSILSPTPASLPAVSPNFFSPPGGAGAGAGGLAFFNELSPAFLTTHHPFLGGAGGASITTTGASSPFVPSPGAYYWDLFNHYPNS